MYRLIPTSALGCLLLVQLAHAQAPQEPAQAAPQPPAQPAPAPPAPAPDAAAPDEPAPPAPAPASATPTPTEAAAPGAAPSEPPPPTAGQPAAAPASGAPMDTTPMDAAAPASSAAPPDAPPAPEEPGTKPITLLPSASMFSRYELRAGYEDIGASRARFLEGDAIATRLRLGLRTSDVALGDDASVAVQFTPQASGFWGQLPNTLADANLGLHEAYLHYQSGGFSLDTGRLVLNYGDSLLIGSVDWHQTGRSFDGIKSRFKLDAEAWLDLFVTQLAEGLGGADTDVGAGDGYFLGVYSNLGPLIAPALALEPYLLMNFSPALTQPADPADPASVAQERGSATQVTLGTRVKGEAGAADYRVEADVQFGKRPDFAGNPTVFAYQADAEIGVSAKDAGFRAALEGFFASGDDPDTDKAEGFDQLYPTGHKWLGLMDVIPGRSNIAGGVLHLAYSGLKPVVLKSQAHVFVRPQTPDDVSGYTGTELDIAAIYAIAAQLKLRLLYGVFVPGDEQFPDDSAAHYFETELRLDF